MHRTVLALWLIATAGCATSVERAPSPAPKTFAATPGRAIDASNRFGFDLYERLKRDGGNLICSPLSASIALSMMTAGARGQTLVELSSVLRIDPRQRSESDASFGSLLNALNQLDGRHRVQLQLADRLFAQKDVSFERDFLTVLEQRYDAPLAQVDFAHDTERARVDINQWAALRTHDRIPQFLAHGAVSPDTRLVLINALYFKGAWVFPFRPDNTTDRPFTTTTQALTARTMSGVVDVRHARVRDATLVELPYDGGLSMVVILPDAVGGLDEIESRLAASYADWLAALRYKRVDLELPRWKVTSTLPLKDALGSMGIRTAFNRDADLAGIASLKPLFVHEVLQQAFVDVDELGTEAAGVTAEIIEGGAGRSDLERVAFRADHPFMYLIRENRTGAILFIGRVVEPGT